MSHRVIFALCLSVGLLLLCLPDPVRAQDDQPPAECCFSHVNYQGICRVTPAKDDTCDSILKYLNTPGTVGKDYCNGSRIRGGWTKAECPKDEGTSAQGTHKSRPVCVLTRKN